MRKTSFIASLVILCLAMATCYYDNEEALYPDLSGQCDTLNVTYNGMIKPMISNNCLSCHSNANASFGGGIVLENYADVKEKSALILPAINHTGRVQMPPSGKLSQCLIDMFRIWVDSGMPE